MKYPKPVVERPKPKRRVYKPMRAGEGVQPGTVEWELNRRRDRKEEREAVRRLAELKAEREEWETPSIWQSVLSIFRRFWPKR
jgi:hypothetical protein